MRLFSSGLWFPLTFLVPPPLDYYPYRDAHARRLVTLISDMVFLWAFGPEIENAMNALRYFIFYIVGRAVAILAQVASALVHGSCSGTCDRGRNGRIYGLLTAAIKFACF
jgi:membrane associated rhomboid family serine protease